MNLSLHIARRYLFSKKKVSSINLISAISVIGVALCTAAMLVTLSVFNGFEEMVSTLFTSFDPEIRIESKVGKTFDGESVRGLLEDLESTEVVSMSIEEHVMLRFKDAQTMATIKGVDENFRLTAGIDSILYGEGDFILEDGIVHYAIPGIGLASDLATGIKFTDPLEVYAPRQDAQVNIANPNTAFLKTELYSSGLVFMVSQDKYDDSYILCSLDYARKALGYDDGLVSAIGIKVREGSSLKEAKEEIASALAGKGDFRILDRYEQQEDIYKIMELEKMVSWLFLTFILLIASFNIIGSLSMLIIDKKEDISTLRMLGASECLIRRIFLLEGWMISLCGACIGIILGLALAWAQATFGIIRLGNNFIIDAYPVKVTLQDIILVLLTVAVTGFLAVIYPVRKTLSPGSINATSSSEE